MNIEMIDKIFNYYNKQELHFINIHLYNGDNFKIYYECIENIIVDKERRTLIIEYKDFSGNTNIDYFSSNRIQHIEINKEDFKKSEKKDFKGWEW